MMRAVPAQMPVLTEEERSQGWRLLFDGKTTEGWTGGIGLPFPERAWAIEEGLLHLKNPANGPSLYSQDRFNNFDLRFEWKISPGANTGVKYLSVAGRRAPDFLAAWNTWMRGLIVGTALFFLFVVALVFRVGFLRQKWAFRISVAAAILAGLWLSALAWGVHRGYDWAAKYPPGFEYQIIDDAGRNIQHAEQKTAGLYDLFGPSGAHPHPPGEWNESRILVDGNRVEHWLNGTKTLEYTLGSAALEQVVARSKFASLNGFAQKQPGYFELQNHGTEVWFRNLKIRTF